MPIRTDGLLRTNAAWPKPSLSAEDVLRLQAERDALIEQRKLVARGGSTAAAVARPAPEPTAPTAIPVIYRYNVVGTVPILPDAASAIAPLTAPVGAGVATARRRLSFSAEPERVSEPACPPSSTRSCRARRFQRGAPGVYTRFFGPETIKQFFDPQRFSMRGDLRPRLYQAGGAAQQQAFATFKQYGIGYSQLGELRRVLLERGVTGLTSEEMVLLRRVAGVQARISGATPASPLLSLTELVPDEALARLPPTAINRAYVVRVQISPSDVRRVNELLPKATQALSNELEVVVARDLLDPSKVKILSVTRNPAPVAPLGGWVGPALTWTGRGLMVLGAGIATYEIVTASGPNRREQQGRAFGGFAGGIALGAFGAGLCVGLWIFTAGLGILACGLAFGALGALGGSALGGAAGRQFD